MKTIVTFLFSLILSINAFAQEDCLIDINCSLGDDWQDEKKGVVKIYDNTYFHTFSGSTINSTDDSKIYVLTAYHCLEKTTNNYYNVNDYLNWTFYWNYECTTCEGTLGTYIETDSAIVCAVVPSSDCALIELINLPFEEDPDFCMYLNGWDRSGSSLDTAVCINHIWGLPKKIAVSGEINYNNYYWGVDFSVGETGNNSSGSPLFDEDFQIVGQLKGPSSAIITQNCDNLDGVEVYFGKLNSSWSELDEFLNPNGSLSSLDGRYAFPPSNPEITGLDEDYICSSDEDTLKLVGLPVANESIIWNSSANINIITPQNCDSCIFEPTNSYYSEGWITATIYVGCASKTVEIDSILLNPPPLDDIELTMRLGSTVIEPYYDNSWALEPNTNYNLTLTYDNTTGCSLSDIDFDLPASFTVNFTSNFHINFNTPNTNNYYSYTVSGETCCSSDQGLKYGWFLVGSMYSMSFTPNPSSGETVITLADEKGELDVDIEWDLEIYDRVYSMKVKKEKIKGKEQYINVAGWKKGIYLVKAKVEDKFVFGKLVVE